MKRLTVILLSFFAGTAFVLAQSGWKLDKAHSSITFAAQHMVISEVIGSFKDFTITLNSAKDDFSDAEIHRYY